VNFVHYGPSFAAVGQWSCSSWRGIGTNYCLQYSAAGADSGVIVEHLVALVT